MTFPVPLVVVVLAAFVEGAGDELPLEEPVPAPVDELPVEACVGLLCVLLWVAVPCVGALKVALPEPVSAPDDVVFCGAGLVPLLVEGVVPVVDDCVPEVDVVAPVPVVELLVFEVGLFVVGALVVDVPPLDVEDPVVVPVPVVDVVPPDEVAPVVVGELELPELELGDELVLVVVPLVGFVAPPDPEPLAVVDEAVDALVVLDEVLPVEGCEDVPPDDGDVVVPLDGELPVVEPDDVLVLGVDPDVDPPDDVLGVVPDEVVLGLVVLLDDDGLLVPPLVPDVEPDGAELVLVPLEGELLDEVDVVVPEPLEGDEPLVVGLLVEEFVVDGLLGVVPVDDVLGLEEVLVVGCELPDEEPPGPVEVLPDGAEVLDDGLLVDVVEPLEVDDEGLVEDVLPEGALVVPDDEVEVGGESALRSTVWAIAADGTVSSGTKTSMVTTTSENHRLAILDRASICIGRDDTHAFVIVERRAPRLLPPALPWRRSPPFRIELSPTFPLRGPLATYVPLPMRTCVMPFAEKISTATAPALPCATDKLERC